MNRHKNESLVSLGAGGRRLLQTPTGGVIETLIGVPEAAPLGAVLIAHPHPLMGGTLDNKVVHTLARVANRAGWVALRFNFRGAGQSAGTHDGGRGETDDVVWLASWLREAVEGPLVLAGFSFGGWVTLNAAHRVGAQGLFSVAPPFGKYVVGEKPPSPGCPWRVLHSKDDEVVSYAETCASLSSYVPSPELITVDGAGHFFHARLGDVQDAFLPFLQQIAR